MTALKVCPRNHEPDWYQRPDGGLVCRPCRNEYMRGWMRRKYGPPKEVSPVCKRGHEPNWYFRPSGYRVCRLCRNESYRAGRASDPARFLAHGAKYREANRENIRPKAAAYSREYYRKNREVLAPKARDKARAVRAIPEERERLNAIKRAWSQTERGQFVKKVGRWRRKASAPAPEHLKIILRDPCVYCGGPGGTLEHITPVSRGGGGEWENLASACMRCNAAKGVQPLWVFLLNRSAA